MGRARDIQRGTFTREWLYRTAYEDDDHEHLTSDQVEEARLVEWESQQEEGRAPRYSVRWKARQGWWRGQGSTGEGRQPTVAAGILPRDGNSHPWRAPLA